MKITLLPSSLGTHADGNLQFLTSFLINDTIAIDAGSLGFARTAQEQAAIRHVLLTHAHVDHIASLPIFLENVYGRPGGAVTVHASEAVLDCLQHDIFNDRLWPDFIHLSRQGTPFLHLGTLSALTPVELDGLRITPVPVDHVVPTFGFIVEDESAAVVFSSDTGPTELLWQQANAVPNLKAVFLEATFPNAMSSLADRTKHLTATTFAQEARKVRRDVPILAFHIKPRFAAQVLAELQELHLPNLVVVQTETVYTF